MQLQLNEKQFDALTEVANIGMSQAAIHLSTLLNDEVMITIPKVIATTRGELKNKLNIADDGDILNIYQDIFGNTPGTVNLLFHDRDSKALASALVGAINNLCGVDLGEYEHEAIMEISNVIISSCMSSIANFLNIEIQFGAPCIDNLSPYSEELNKQDQDEMILLFETKLSASHRDVEGMLIVSLSKHATKIIMNNITKLLSDLEG